jgi:hypothetical protein
VTDHSHPELEDRITAEMALVRTEIAALGGRVDVVAAEMAGLRAETRRGFTDVTHVLGQILTRLPEPGDDR